MAQSVVALPSELYERATAHVENRLTGTHYLSADGEKKSGSTTDLYKEDGLVDFE